MIPMSEYETLRQRHAAQYQAQLGEHLARIDWPEERLRAERQRGLREIITTAKDRSPWHAKRLAHVDPESATEADLPSIPTMTKQDLMENFDDILTNRRLTRANVEAHVDGLKDDAYLLDEYHVVASGGSSGTRGVFVYDWNGWLLASLSMLRFSIRAQLALLGDAPAVRANIAAGKATHMTFALARMFGAANGVVNVPATLPLAEIVTKLNDLRPSILSGYPTMMVVLAHEAASGRLHIEPKFIRVGSEPLLPEMRATLEATWDCPVLNLYGASEGASASSCGRGRGLHLNEDLCIFEPVDGDGRATPAGERAARLYITPLFNLAQPLIRYELTDEVTVLDEPCPCGSPLRRIDDVQGRADDIFVYPGGVIVHPLVFRSVLGGNRHVLEYQVRQIEGGASIALRIAGDLGVTALRETIERELRRVGLQSPVVTIQAVASFDRLATGKLKRFVPLSAQ